MFGAAVYFQLGEQTPSQTILRQHSAHRGFHQSLRLFQAHFSGMYGTNSARVSGMAMIQLVIGLGAGQQYLRGIDDNHKIARILMGSEIGTMFAAQDEGGARGDTAQRAPCRVDQDPSPAPQGIFVRNAFGLLRQLQLS